MNHQVFDCWFESGSMPYAQSHYPFENKELWEKGFPADFIAEGVDQTRGWFYTLMVLSTALFDRPPFKNLIVNGMVLAADGKKMSKVRRGISSLPLSPHICSHMYHIAVCTDFTVLYASLVVRKKQLFIGCPNSPVMLSCVLTGLTVTLHLVS